MHKDFYASGFLYHPPTQQILLHQPSLKTNSSASLWSMLGGEGRKIEDAPKTFQRIIYERLKIKLPAKRIYPVYDYFHQTFHKMHYVFYTEVVKIRHFRPRQGSTLAWFTFKQTLKLPFSEETKQDIIVAERVIRAQKEQHL